MQITAKEFSDKHNVKYVTVNKRIRERRILCRGYQKTCAVGGLSRVFEEADLLKAVSEFKTRQEGEVTLREYCAEKGIKHSTLYNHVKDNYVRQYGLVITSDTSGRKQILYKRKDLDKLRERAYPMRVKK